jgi:hypothetical protein
MSGPLYPAPEAVRLGQAGAPASWAVAGHGPTMSCLAGLGHNAEGRSSNGPTPGRNGPICIYFLYFSLI